MGIELKTLAGRVSHTNQQQVTYGHIQQGLGGVRGNIKTRQWFTFRVNGRPTTMNGTPTVADDDVATVIGVDKGGEFVGYSIRNHTTGVDYTCPAKRLARSAYTLMGIPVAFGLMGASSFGVIAGILGFLLFSPAFFIGMKFRKSAVAFKKANGMLPTLPTPTLPASS